MKLAKHNRSNDFFLFEKKKLIVKDVIKFIHKNGITRYINIVSLDYQFQEQMCVKLQPILINMFKSLNKVVF